MINPDGVVIGNSCNDFLGKNLKYSDNFDANFSI